MRNFAFLLILILSAFGTFITQVNEITGWLIGINFTLAIFSINFTFFGYQLSKYKALYDSVSTRQWVNIAALLVLPLVPFVTYLFVPQYFGKMALATVPILLFSAIDNALLTTRYLTPGWYIKSRLSDTAITYYLSRLSLIVDKEVNEHEKYLNNRDKFQIPPHGFSFEPTSLGCKEDDKWDSVITIIKQSLGNNDHPTFKNSIDSTLKLLISFYKYEHPDKDNYRIAGGIKRIARSRLRSIVKYVKSEDKEGFFLYALSNELARFLLSEEIVVRPCSELASAVAEDLVLIGKAMLESDDAYYPLKALNTLHSIHELTLLRLENTEHEDSSLDSHSIQMYAYHIKELGSHSFKNGNTDFAYRCMESLCYLGCNAAKNKATYTVEATLNSISQLGREARSLGIHCFWNRCLVPVESHAEEFMGHILTWLVHDINEKGEFFMKEYAEQAYSRIRGKQCEIKPKANSNPCFWLCEILKDGQTIPHVEEAYGMHGYNGKLDYSDFNNLKEYALMGISPSSGAVLMRTSPIPIQFEIEENIEKEED